MAGKALGAFRFANFVPPYFAELFRTHFGGSFAKHGDGHCGGGHLEFSGLRRSAAHYQLGQNARIRPGLDPHRPPYITLFPGLAIVFTVLGFNLLGDGLRDAADPQLRGGR